MVPVCECPEPITDMLTRVVHSASRVKGTAHSALLASLTGDGKAHTAVLMHARFSNLPLQLVGPLHRCRGSLFPCINLAVPPHIALV